MEEGSLACRLAAGALYRGVTAPLARLRFLYSHNKLLHLTPRAARYRYIFFNQTPKWPAPILNARPALGTTIPFALISSLAYTVYTSGKRVWLTPDDPPRTQFLKSAALGGAAGSATRFFAVSNPHYRMILPAPYLATALPIYDYLRPTYSIASTSLLAALAGSITDAVVSRISPNVVYILQRHVLRAEVNSLPSRPEFRSAREMLLWTFMHASRALPRAILLGSFEFFLTLFEPFKRYAAAAASPRAPPRSRPRSESS